MQQYFDVPQKGKIVTVFHTLDSLSFDLEHYGYFEVEKEEILEFLDSEEDELIVTHNPSEKHPDLAEKRPLLYPDETEEVGKFFKQENGSLLVHFCSDTEIVIQFTQEQVEVLQESITMGDVERYDDGMYPIEHVSLTGERERAEHEE